jgi:hypothetical protein
MLSDRTAEYVEATIREGDNFDYLKCLRRVQEEESEAKHVLTAFPLVEPVAAEIG